MHNVEDEDRYGLMGVTLEVDDSGFPILPPMTEREIIERVMTQHWDMAACRCWICTAGNAIGCRPRDQYIEHHADVVRMPKVRVPWVKRMIEKVEPLCGDVHYLPPSSPAWHCNLPAGHEGRHVETTANGTASWLPSDGGS